MPALTELLESTAVLHRHLCPRQVLGVRMGMLAGKVLGLELPQKGKRLITIAETDGCVCDGISAATGCTVGHRTLRVEDYGKIAATFVDVKTGQAVRVAPRLDVRERAYVYAPDEPRHYFAQLKAYQVMPDGELLSIAPVRLRTPIEAIVSRAGVRVNCEVCGEEIINQREVEHEGLTLCRACAGTAYYHSLLAVAPAFAPVDDMEIVLA
jgi:formylmethanofuran dehydrogenase subunit E